MLRSAYMGFIGLSALFFLMGCYSQQAEMSTRDKEALSKVAQILSHHSFVSNQIREVKTSYG